MMEVLSVIHDPRRKAFKLAQEVDGLLVQFTFPEDTLEWRAAEYHILPTEVDLLLDIVLYERFIEEEPGQMPDLWTAPTTDDARDRHVAKVMAVKQSKRPAGPNSWRTQPQRIARLKESGLPQFWLDPVADDDALKPIRDNHIMDLPVLAEKALLVQQQRDKFKAQSEAASHPLDPRQISADDRAAMIRAMRAVEDGK